jgi:diadenosine tetraphosphate (Ap4A) HIT family hydrolase
MSFIIDPRLISSCFELGDWPLSRVFLKNQSEYPWFILVPREPHLQELDQLPPCLRYVFIDEICQLSSLVRAYFKPDKLNIGALGNIVSQLHVHVIARTQQDALWPNGVWQADQTEIRYSEQSADQLCEEWRRLIKTSPPVTNLQTLF